MMPNEPRAEARCNEETNWLSSKPVSIYPLAISIFRVICTLILLSTVGIRGLAAQSIEADTKTALASEWMQPDGVAHLLNALELLTSSSADPFRTNLEVLVELKAGDPNHLKLYRAAMGVTDNGGRPKVQGLPSFLDMLAKANTLGKMTPTQEHDLFNSTQHILDGIYHNEPVALVEIQNSFTEKYKYLALYQLLRATWKKTGAVQDLERLRAAFASDADGLAKQVAEKVSDSKQ